MKLLAIEMSRLTALTYATRLPGQPFFPAALTSFLNKYQFAGYPKDLIETNRQQLEFKHGLFHDTAIETFDLYTDGLVVSARSNTSILDEFVEDVGAFMEKEWEVSFVKSYHVDRMYESNLLITTDKNVLKPLDALAAISDQMGDFLFEASGLRTEFQPFGFSLAADQAKIASLKPGLFRLERKLGIEYDFISIFRRHLCEQTIIWNCFASTKPYYSLRQQLSAAFRAISARRSAVIFSARFFPPSAPRPWRQGFCRRQ